MTRVHCYRPTSGFSAAWRSSCFTKNRQSVRRVLVRLSALATLLAACASAQADMIFVDRTAFEAGLPTGFYTDDFSSAPNAIGSPAGSYFGSGGLPSIGYSISAAGGLFIAPILSEPAAKFIGPWEDMDDLVVTFNRPVYRVGIEVNLEDFAGPRSGTVFLDFSSGASASINVPNTGNFAFIGLYSDTPLSSMTIRAQGGGVFTNTTRLTIAVPEPSSALLLACCAAVCIACQPRRKYLCRNGGALLPAFTALVPAFTALAPAYSLYRSRYRSHESR